MFISPLAANSPSNVPTPNGATPRDPAGSDLSLRLRVSYPASDLALLSVAGEIDLATVPKLERLLWPRLRSTLSGVVVDLREVTFLGLPGVELLIAAHDYARHRGLSFSVVTGNHAVDRVLDISQVALPRFETTAAALFVWRPRETVVTATAQPA